LSGTTAAAQPMAQSLSLFDARPFFEKALVFGVQNGIIDAAKLEAIQTDAPKGMVQIARYFGTEFLRPELERAKDRLVNLVSMNLELHSNGDLRKAAELLRDNSFLSRSKASSDMLKALIAMPQNSHFGMNERGGFTDDQIPVLAEWTLRPLTDYRAELALRQTVAVEVDAALWIADYLGMDADELAEEAPDAEAVIRTALLVWAAKQTQMPDWTAFQKIIAALRKRAATAIATNKAEATRVPSLPVPKNLPAEYKTVVQAVRESVLADMPKLLDASLAARKLFAQTPAFLGRYFWLEDMVEEINHFDREASAAWNKVTGGHSDDGSLLTLFLCIAAGSSPKTLLTEKAAATLIRKIRKSGLKSTLAEQYIADHAPAQHQSDYLRTWSHFLEDVQATLESDHDYELHDALALLRRECNVA
jgi:hypothetical protein